MLSVCAAIRLLTSRSKTCIVHAGRLVPGWAGAAAGSPPELLGPTHLCKQVDIRGQIYKGARHLPVLIGISQQLKERAYRS